MISQFLAILVRTTRPVEMFASAKPTQLPVHPRVAFLQSEIVTPTKIKLLNNYNTKVKKSQ